MEQYRDSHNLTSRQRLHREASTAKVPWHQFVFRHLLRSPEGSHVLEVGCGPGSLWVDNASAIPASWSITLTDQSSGMVDAATAAVRGLSVAIQVQAATVTDLPFADGCFQMVVANHMLYHVSDLPRGLAEIARVLVPGGLLVAATNGPGHLIELRKLVRGVAGERESRSASSTFDLVNGPAQLRPWFTAIRISRHRNRLWVRDPELVIDYLRSMPPGAGPAGSEALIRERIVRAIGERGGFAIHPQAGVIVANRRRRLLP